MTEFGEAQAESLLKLGWRQGSAIHVRGPLAEAAGLAEGTLVVVLTQSCSVVSPSLARDPLVELACMDPSAEPFKENSELARGQNMRKLCVPAENNDGQGYLIDINRRCFVDRSLLLDTAPDGPVFSVATGEKIGRWVASTYARAALPNNLVGFFRQDGCEAKMEKILKTGFDGEPLHRRIRALYADWSSEEEVDSYRLRIDFLCEDEDAAGELEAGIEKLFGRPLPDVHSSERLALNFNIRTTDSTFVSDLDGMRRFSRWDFFSRLADDPEVTA